MITDNNFGQDTRTEKAQSKMRVIQRQAKDLLLLFKDSSHTFGMTRWGRG